MKYLRVIIKDPSPTLHHGEPPPPGHRSVRIELTPEQAEQIDLKVTGEVAGKPIREVITNVFFLTEETPVQCESIYQAP